jgi:hypothetical protein
MLMDLLPAFCAGLLVGAIAGLAACFYEVSTNPPEETK